MNNYYILEFEDFPNDDILEKTGAKSLVSISEEEVTNLIDARNKVGRPLICQSCHKLIRTRDKAVQVNYGYGLKNGKVSCMTKDYFHAECDKAFRSNKGY
jgi:hypothetical protein